MSLDGRGVDQHFGRWAARRRQSVEDVRPDTFRSPAHKSVVERLPRTIDRRRIGPAATRFEHMHDAADHPPVINPRDTPRIRWQQRRKPPKLLIAQPEIIRHLQAPTVWKLESDYTRIINPFYGSRA